jgi:hypothetical protein
MYAVQYHCSERAKVIPAHDLLVRSALRKSACRMATSVCEVWLEDVMLILTPNTPIRPDGRSIPHL